MKREEAAAYLKTCAQDARYLSAKLSVFQLVFHNEIVALGDLAAKIDSEAAKIKVLT